jgi:fructose-bisphosphate aldolase class 1
MGDFKERLEQMRTHPGFIAALDQSGASMPHAPPAYGIQDDAWSNEAQMASSATPWDRNSKSAKVSGRVRGLTGRAGAVAR